MNEEIPPVPYEDGDRCIFYAVQDASMYFNKRPLAVEDRGRYQQQRERGLNIYKSITGVTEELGGELKVSLGIVMSRLAENNIVSDTFYCGKDVKDILCDLNYIKRENIQFKVSEGYTEVSYPAIFIIGLGYDSDDEDLGHVWFCESQEDFDKNRNNHMSKDDSVILCAHLKKREAH
ncbi:MAG: hypothetical protein ABIA11_04240 [Patescibacteria group bacterium]